MKHMLATASMLSGREARLVYYVTKTQGNGLIQSKAAKEDNSRTNTSFMT